MKARRTGFTAVAAVFTLAALVAVIGAAQAAPSTKKYGATVHVTNATVTPSSATLTLTLRNDPTSKQTLGSANFTAPVGVDNITVVAGSVAGNGVFTVTSEGRVVMFRSTVALTKGQSVSANVSVTISPTDCSNATWATAVKQSNDFSGTGNDFTKVDSISNLRPLGSFAFEPIGTQVTAEVFAPQLETGLEATVAVTALDVCGDKDAGYGFNFDDAWAFAPSDDVPPTPRLDEADLTDIGWEATGDGSATMTPVVVETSDILVVTDDASNITAASDPFDVVEKLCTILDDTCEWDHGNGKIKAEASGPPDGEEGEPDPSLGIGFNADLSFVCDGNATPVGDTLININPRDYPDGSTVEVTLTYDNSIIGGGSADSYSFCLSKDNGETWGTAPVAACADVPPNCILDQRKSSGDLVIVLLLKAEDPWGGLS